MIADYRGTHPDDSLADVLFLDRPKLDWARLVLSSMDAAEWWCQQTSAYGSGKYYFVYHLNNNALRTDEEVQRADARRSRNLHERNTEQNARISDTMVTLQRENASLRRDQGSLLNYVSDAVGHVIENQNAIVNGFTTFAARHLELSRVDGDIANLRQSIMSTTQQISTERFQGLLLHVTAAGRPQHEIDAMKEETAQHLNANNRELTSLQAQLAVALERKKGIEAMPALVLPAVATAPPKPPAINWEPTESGQAEPDARPAKVAKFSASPSTGPQSTAPASSQGHVTATSQADTTSGTPNTPQVSTSARRPKPSNPTTSPAAASKPRPKPKAATKPANDEDMHVDVSLSPPFPAICPGVTLSVNHPLCPRFAPRPFDDSPGSFLFLSSCFTQLLIIYCLYASCQPSRGVNLAQRSHAYPPPRPSRSLIPCWLMIIVALSLLPLAHAHPLKLLTLNCTFMPNGATAKFDTLTNIIDTVRPHIVILTEAGLIAGHTFPWSHRQYRTHAWPCSNKKAISYSQVMLTREDVAVAGKIPPPPEDSAQGRVCGLDIWFAGKNGTRRTVRVMGAYAPSAYRETHGTRQGLWDAIKRLTADAPNWIVGGDFNISLNTWEHSRYSASYAASFPSLAAPYRGFLQATSGTDTWNLKNQVSAERDWTYLDHVTGARRIIDRFAISQNLNCVNTRTIETIIPATKHRAVVVEVELDMLIPTTGSLDNKAPQRLIRPKTGSKDFDDRFQRFRDEIHAVFPEGSSAPELTDNDQYDSLLRHCHDALTTAAARSFKRKRPRPVNPGHMTAPTSAHRQATTRYRIMGKLIHAITHDSIQALLDKNQDAAHEWSRITREYEGQDVTPALLRRHRKSLLKEVRNTRWNPNYVPNEERLSAMHKTALKGGPIKHLFNPHHVTKPPLVRIQPMPGLEESEPQFAADPQDRLRAFTDYYRNLLTQASPPQQDQAKPWMSTEASARFRSAVANARTPLVWPKPMTMDNLTSLLRRGNPHPSPGPDGWEKWTLRHAPNSFLNRILALANYTICNNYFPPAIKGNYISPLYKKGDITDPSNYRGVVFANCLQSLVGSWATHLIQGAAWKFGFLPDTQIATQKGTQVGDLTAFLSQIQCLAEATEQTLYAIKGDHIKGFDNLSATAFPDVVAFFGLPEALLDFEKARSEAVSLRVKSQDGVGAPFYTHGQTKQGDSSSPIKYTLTMAMLHHWLLEKLAPADIPLLRTPNATSGTPHTAADRLDIKLLSVEAMDDSIFFATSWEALKRIVRLCDDFQTTYGILTAWDNPDKTTCFTFGKQITTVDDFLEMHHLSEGPAIDRGRLFQEFATATGTHKVPVVDERVILRTAINDTRRMRAELESVITEAPLAPERDLPLPLVRKAVWGLIIPKVRARLALQPIRPTEARELDGVLSRKILDCVRLPHTSSSILCLPTKYHGFGFPSIYRINGELAIGTLLRSLNHKLPTLAKAAAMTHAHWMCGVKKCCDPLTRPLAEQTSGGREIPSHIRNPSTIPVSWHSAAQYLATAGVSLISTDLTHLLTSDAFEHTSNIIAQSGRHTVRPRLTHLIPKPTHTPTSAYIQELLRLERGRSREADPAHELLVWYSNAPLHDILSPYDPSLLLSRTARRDIMNNTLRSVARPSIPTATGPLWASDGSHLNADDSRGAASTTAAVTGPLTASYRLTGQQTTSAHGELVGLIAALQLAGRHRTRDPKVVTDYLAAVKAVETAQSAEFDPTSWNGRRLQAHYLWLAQTIRKAPRSTKVEHIAAHTDLQDDMSKLNDAADRAAKRAHDRQPGADVATLAAPTAFMTRYVPHRFDTGYMPDSWVPTLDDLLTCEQISNNSGPVNSRLFDSPARQPMPTSDYFYTRSTAKFLPKVQYLARAGHLNTPYKEWLTGSRDNPGCPFCGNRPGDDTHLFRDCRIHQGTREEAIEEAVARFWVPRTRGGVDDAVSNADKLRPVFRQYLTQVLEGDNGRLSFWNGNVTQPPPQLPEAAALQAHDFAIKLAARIYGKFVPHRSNYGLSIIPNRRDELNADLELAEQMDTDAELDTSSDGEEWNTDQDETYHVLYPGDSHSDDDPDPMGTKALFPVAPLLLPAEPLGNSRLVGTHKVVGRKRTATTRHEEPMPASSAGSTSATRA